MSDITHGLLPSQLLHQELQEKHLHRAEAKQAPLIQDKASSNTLKMPLQKTLVISPFQNLHQGLFKFCWPSLPGDTHQL